MLKRRRWEFFPDDLYIIRCCYYRRAGWRVPAHCFEAYPNTYRRGAAACQLLIKFHVDRLSRQRDRTNWYTKHEQTTLWLDTYRAIRCTRKCVIFTRFRSTKTGTIYFQQFGNLLRKKLAVFVYKRTLQPTCLHLNRYTTNNNKHNN